MATTANRSITLTYTGDLDGSEELEAADNVDQSPAQVQLVTLAMGDNVIAKPGGGSTTVALTIKKPADNEAVIKLKGDAADVGVTLHKTDPDSISIDAEVDSVILNAAAEIVGVRLYWS